MAKIAGTFKFDVNDIGYKVSGVFDINDGQPKRDGQIGENQENAGYSEKGQIPFMDGGIFLTPGIHPKDIKMITDGTVSCETATGTWVLEGAYYAGEGTYNTGEGSLQVRFEGTSMDFIKA